MSDNTSISRNRVNKLVTQLNPEAQKTPPKTSPFPSESEILSLAQQIQNEQIDPLHYPNLTKFSSLDKSTQLEMVQFLKKENVDSLFLDKILSKIESQTDNEN
jgi:hypothetical protein